MFTAEGNVVPVTVIEAGPCVVLQKKDQENDATKLFSSVSLTKKRITPTSRKVGHA
ncbi:hypothetical protein BN871_DJ_00010, partial [Paenibacillus sp. P22]